MQNKTLIQNVIKNDGRKDPFSEDKLRRSLLKAGASRQEAAEIVDALRDKLYPDITTREIYDIAFDLLRERAFPAAARYHLKRAILELGPSGFPFEQFVGELFRHKGYAVQTNMIVSGFCVKHEVDVLATRQPETHYIECKYHQAGIPCDVKTSLYVHARFRDIVNKRNINGIKEAATGWLVTNTRLSADALQYGECAGLRLVSWDYPAGNGLKDMIDQAALYPITCLTTLSPQEKSRLLYVEAVLCSDLVNRPVSLSAAGIPAEKRQRVLEEATALCGVALHGDGD
ncbi:ATP cone domain-containing protein [Chitinophaga sp. YIM B06452]|uniref:ATP cone domain-containing protein n=1 Tax=Chitinophaga sp. YIM B06452 TaxID=3082158 RepID=UPI0031FF0780